MSDLSKPSRPAGHLSGGQVLGGLAVGVAVIWYLGAGHSASTESRDDIAPPTPYMAYIQCQAFVKSSLKSPASAEFPTKPLAAIDAGSGVFVVNSSVDAQNSFGALLRNDWSCKAQHLGGNPSDPRSWKLLNLSMS